MVVLSPYKFAVQERPIEYGPRCHDHGITGYGNPNGRVVFLGIAPGRDEVRRSGRPFTGPSGELLDESLTAIGLSRDDYYATNLICWQKDKPTPREIAACATRLDMELASVVPYVIVTMGQLVYESLMGVPFTRHRGVPEWNAEYRCYVLPTFHPSGILHNGLLIHDLVRDLRKIPHIMEWPPNTALADVPFRVVQTREEAQHVLDALPRNVPISLDVETDPIQVGEGSDNPEKVQRDREIDDIDAFTDRLTCFSVSWGYDDTVVFPPNVLEGSGLTFPTDVQWAFHYGISDVQVIARNTNPMQWLPIVDDTMLLSYAFDERGGIHRLKTLAREYLGATFYEDEVRALRKKGQPVPPDMMYEYNARDAAYTWRLLSVLGERAREENTTVLYRDTLIPASNALAEIAYRGVHIDQRVLHRLFLEWAPRLQDQEDALVEMARRAGWDRNVPINTNSPMQLAHLLFDIIGLPIIKRTPTGAPSCDKETLVELALTGNQFVVALQQLRRLKHIFNEYVLGILDDLKRDARIHPVPLPHGTRTGRLSYHNPPIQTQPNEEVVGEEYGQIRYMFGAESDDYVIVGADYKQAEVWTAYYQSGDAQMYEDLQRDFHRYGASEVYQLPVEQVTSAMRRSNKYVAFGIMYGRQAPALAKAELKNDPAISALIETGDMRGAIRIVERYIRRWLSRYPEYNAWKDRQKQLVMEEGELVTDAGRKRRFLLVLGEDAYHLLNSGINFPIQSLAHDVLLASLVELHHLLKPLDSYILFEVHDALIMHVSKCHFQEVAQLIYKVMTKPRFGMGPLPIELKVGRSWGEGKKWEIGDDLPW